MIVGADGIEALTIARLSDQAQLAPRQLYRHYPDTTTCLYDTYDEVSRSVLADFAAAFAAEPVGWRRAVTLVGHKLLTRMAARPAEARLCFVEVLRGDHELLRRRNAARRRMVDLFADELRRRKGIAEVPRVQLELMIGAGFQAIAAAIADGPISELVKLEPELVSRAGVFDFAAA